MTPVKPSSFFYKLRISHRLFAISLSFLLPIGVMLYFIVQSVNGYILFATLERYGNTYQRPLEELLNFIPQHERLVRLSFEGHEQSVGSIISLQAKIDKAFENLTAVNQKFGVALQFTDEGLGKRKRGHFRVENVKPEWEDLKKSYSSLSMEASYEKHRHLVMDVRTMITHCGDTSNMILDPDLDSYYLMDSTLLILPQTQDRLSEILHYGEKALKKGNLTPEERQQLAIYAVELKEADLNHNETDVTTYLNEDRNFYGTSESLQKNIPPAFQNYRVATQKFIDLINHIISSKVPESSEDFVAIGLKAREESFRLWEVAINEFDTLLSKRIAYYQHSRFLALFWAFLSLIVSIFLVILITRDISKPLKNLMEGVDEIAKGNLTKRVEIKARDEIGQLAVSFNMMAIKLKESYENLEEKVKQRTSQLEVANRQLGAEVSERKLVESKLRTTIEELKDMQEKLIHSEKMAAVGQLAAGVAHEINNPVAFVMSNLSSLAHYISSLFEVFRATDVLKKSILDDQDLTKALKEIEKLSLLEKELKMEFISQDTDQLIRESQSGLERVKKIVTDLKTFSHSDKGEIIPQNLNDIIEGILNIVLNEIKYKAKLIKNYGELPQVKCNAQQLGQVFINIVVNALHAIADTGGTITIRTYCQASWVCVEISDTGRGIPKDIIEKIFDPFFTTKEAGKGTGLGLSISYDIINKHGGRIDVESEVGKGTKFTVSLPVTNESTPISKKDVTNQFVNNVANKVK